LNVPRRRLRGENSSMSAIWQPLGHMARCLDQFDTGPPTAFGMPRAMYVLRRRPARCPFHSPQPLPPSSVTSSPQLVGTCSIAKLSPGYGGLSPSREGDTFHTRRSKSQRSADPALAVDTATALAERFASTCSSVTEDPVGTPRRANRVLFLSTFWERILSGASPTIRDNSCRRSRFFRFCRRLFFMASANSLCGPWLHCVRAAKTRFEATLFARFVARGLQMGRESQRGSRWPGDKTRRHIASFCRSWVTNQVSPQRHRGHGGEQTGRRLHSHAVR
jgi:hypothetical protein